MKIHVISLLAVVLFFTQCKEMEHGPLSTSDGNPSPVTGVHVENTPGGAKVSYTLPGDPELLYVMAKFPSGDGTSTRTVKSSVYANYLVLDGFASTAEVEVELYSVNRAENMSEPLRIKIKPEKPYLEDVFESLEVEETFGGINTRFVNPMGGEYVLHTLYKNAENEWVLYDRLYTKSKGRDYAVRGLLAEPTAFGFYFTDKWRNRSDTLLRNMTPLFEERLDKSKFKHFPLLTDTYEPEYASWAIENLWDNDPNKIFYVKAGLPGAKVPNWFTIDLGAVQKISRMRVNQLAYAEAWMFAAGAPRVFEIYGSNAPPSDGSWDNWTLLGSFESIKPSGLPLGELTSEDIAVAKAGEDFEFAVSTPNVRYLRFKTLKTWSGQVTIAMGEMTLWGQTIQ